MRSPEVFWEQHLVSRDMRSTPNGLHSSVLWVTGLSGGDKSSTPRAVKMALYPRRFRTHVLDGDNIRHGLCGALGFSDADRKESIRRIGVVTKLPSDAGSLVLTVFTSSCRAECDRVRQVLQAGDFIEMYCRCPLEVLKERDAKSLRARARAGKTKQLTGIDSLYEAAENPELLLDTSITALHERVGQVLKLLEDREVITVSKETHAAIA